MLATTGIRRNPDIIPAEAVGERVLLNADTWTYLGLDPVADWLWQQLEEPRRLDWLQQAAAAHFDGPLDTIGADVADFVRHLADRGFVLLDPVPAVN